MTAAIRHGRHILLLLPLLSGCATLPPPVVSRAPPQTARGVVFVVDGAGGGQNASRAIAAVADEMRLPLYVRSFDWTHGPGRGLADATDVAYARCQGRLLAEEIARWRAIYPGVPVYIVAYSAGTTVALAATEQLPTDTLERIVLLAASVSTDYDLRWAMASARQGVDAFSSELDQLYLGVGTSVVGTTDGKRGAAAGRVGFRSPILAQKELWLAARLRQHPWDSSVTWTGNDGGHAGSLQPAYLRNYVLPLLMPCPAEKRP